MAEPRPLPPLPKPFAAEPRPLRAGAGGCGRGVWIGCGTTLVVFLIAALALTLKADEMMVWLLGKLEQNIAANLPADLTAAERERFEASFGELARAVEDGTVDPAALQALQSRLFQISADVERGLSREQVLELTADVERAAGLSPPAAGATPAP